MIGYLEIPVSSDHLLQGFNWLLCAVLGKMGACLRGESSPFAFRLLIYAPLEIIWRMATALFLGSSPNCGLVKSPGNFFNIMIVVLVFSLSMYVSSKSLPDPSWGSACLFFIIISTPLLFQLRRKCSSGFLDLCQNDSFSSVKANALSVFSVLLSVAYLTGLTCALQLLS